MAIKEKSNKIILSEWLIDPWLARFLKVHDAKLIWFWKSACYQTKVGRLKIIQLACNSSIWLIRDEFAN